MKNILNTALCLVIAVIGYTPLATADEVNFNVLMPSLQCTNPDQHNECILTGEMMARGPASLVKPVKYYCETNYSYVAAESAQQEIRFSKRLITHGEITMKDGKARKSISETVTLDLPRKARRVDISTMNCFIEKP